MFSCLVDLARYIVKRGEMKELQRKKLVKDGSDSEQYVYCKDVFNEHECIFVGVPRVASSSVSSSLFGNYAGGHTTARQYRRIFGPSFYRYFKFGFVRNPFSRLVSAYSYLKEGGHPAWPHDKIFQNRINEACNDFSTFVELFVRRPERPDHLLLYPQTYYTSINGRVALDYVGCLERMEEAYAAVKEKLNIKAVLPRLNKSSKDVDGIESAYQSQKTIKAVRKAYSDDFDCFGYEKGIDRVGRPPEIYLQGARHGVT